MNDLIEAYKNTKYKVFEPGIIIEIGILNQDVDDLLLKHTSNEWAFITAYNPYSRVLTNDENKKTKTPPEFIKFPQHDPEIFLSNYIGFAYGKKEMLFLKTITDRYDAQTSPYYAASRLWTDAIIDPLDTRTWISMGIEAANHAPVEKKFNLGVIQV